MPKIRKTKLTQQQQKGLLMILSPSKSYDLSPITKSYDLLEWTSPACDNAKTKEIASILKKKTESQLTKFLGISANIAKTAREYWSTYRDDAWERPNLKPCIFSFSGAAYQTLDSTTCSESGLAYMQNNLRIISALYGVLRPFDLMQPYRLEMGTKTVFSEDKSLKLADWWAPSVSKALSNDLLGRENKILLNLASDEYSAAIDTSLLSEDTNYIKVVFWEEGRTIAIHAKRARGLMVRYVAENNIDTIEGVRKFDSEGYAFVESASDDSKIVFNRKKQTPSKNKRPASTATAKKSPKKRTKTK